MGFGVTVKDLDLEEAFKEKNFKAVAEHFDSLLTSLNFNREHARRLIKAEELGLPIPPKHSDKAQRKRRTVVSKCTRYIINKLNLKESMRQIELKRIHLELTTGDRYDIDHIYPICGFNYTGLHVPWNLEILPKLENSRKYNKNPEEWVLEKKIIKLLSGMD